MMQEEHQIAGGGRKSFLLQFGTNISQNLFLCMRLCNQFWNELETDVHGGNASYHHREQLLRVALEMNQLHHLRLSYKGLRVYVTKEV